MTKIFFGFMDLKKQITKLTISQRPVPSGWPIGKHLGVKGPNPLKFCLSNTIPI